MPRLRQTNPNLVNPKNGKWLEEKEIRMSDVQTQIYNGGDIGGFTSEKDSAQSGANAYQVGGAHYKQFAHETWDVILDWGLGYLDGNAVKYLSRWRHKNGLEDLKKARHYIDKLIETEQAKQATR